MRICSVIVLSLGLALSAPAQADPAAAKKANAAGMKAYKKHDYEAAQKLFEKAIAEDPAFVKAHYNRASMAALQLDIEPLVEEFAWLRGATAPEAARVLAKAKTDPDFRAVSLFDPARAAIGLPPLADTPLDTLALAYGGWWAGVDEGMMEGWIEVHFLPGGKAKGREHSGESGSWYPWSATWRVDGRTLILKKGKGAVETYVLKDCGGDAGLAGLHCLMRDDGGASISPGRS
ncbi:MAG: hypothetical protein IPL61_36775 [Myxococcales bacterium]|nr:hypothetical protein [Myxococcales bacterium]